MKNKKRRKLSRLSKKELRRDFYPMFLNLMKRGLEIEAFLLILSTWNFARFRYALGSFNLENFKKIIKNLDPPFKKFNKSSLKTINFDKYEKKIKKIFKTLSDIKGVEKTGASKLMHLKVPKVFVMWDYSIRDHYGFKRGDADDYFNFLKLMQKLFRNVSIRSDRTLAKLIDEHNIKTITEPILKRSKK